MLRRPKLRGSAQAVQKIIPFASVFSSRVIVYHTDPLKVILREGRERKLGEPRYFGLVGGKVHFRERIEDSVYRETLEETGLSIRGKLRFLARLEMPNRVIEYNVEKYRELGFSLPRNYKNDKPIWLWNPVSDIFVARLNGKLSEEKIEDRELREFDLTSTRELKLVKPRHRMILRAWRNHILQNRAFPTVFYWDT